MHYSRVEVNTLPFTLIYLSIGRFRACDSVRFLCVRPWDEDNLYTGKHVNKVAIITERSHDSDFSQQISHSGFGNYKCRSCRSVWWFKLGFDEPNPPICLFFCMLHIKLLIKQKFSCHALKCLCLLAFWDCLQWNKDKHPEFYLINKHCWGIINLQPCVT